MNFSISREWLLRLSESKAASYALALTAILLVLAIAGGSVADSVKHRQIQQRLSASNEARIHAYRIEQQIDHAYRAAGMVASLLTTVHGEQELDALIPQILNLESGISALQIARDGAPWKTYSATVAGVAPAPAGAGEVPAGIQKGLELTVQGAPTLTMDQRGIIASQPIHARLRPDQPYRWGTASAIINRSDLMGFLHLDIMTREGFDFDLAFVPRNQQQGRPMLASARAPGKDPVTTYIRLTDGDSLVLRVTPVGGWTAGTGTFSDFSLVLVCSLLLGGLIHLLLRRPAQLKREVAIRTQALTQAKKSLEDEMEIRVRAEHAAERSHALLDSVFEHMPNMILIKRIPDLRTIRVNRFCEQLLDSSREELVGRHLEEIFPADVAARFNETDIEAIRTRDVVDLPDERIEVGGAAPRWLHLKKIVLADAAGNPEHLLLLGEDITEHRAAEKQLLQINRSFEVLSGVNRAIVRIRNRAMLMEHICELLVEKGGFPLVWISMAIAGSDKKDMVVRGAHKKFARRLVGTLSDPAHPCGLPGFAPDAVKPMFCSSMNCCDPELVAEGSSLGLVSLAALPLVVNGIAIGSLGIMGDEYNLFPDEERQILTELAEDLSYSLEMIEQEEWRKTAEVSLRLAARIFDNSAEGIMITDAQQRILLVNSTFTSVTGYTQEEAVGHRPDLLSSGQHDAAFYSEMMSTLASEGAWQGEIINRRKDGKIYAEWLTLGVIRDEHDEITHYVAMFSDISPRKQAEEKLEFLSNYDTLTALPNRRLFTDRLEHAAAAVQRGGRGISLLYLDPDRLKTVNDTLGHAAGDTLLKMMAERINNLLRPDDYLARLNGDVFAILANDIREASRAAVLAEKIMTSLRRPFVIDGRELFINSSIGISMYPTDTENIYVLHQHADTALHQAKLLGGNNFQFFRADMNALMVQRLHLENNLRRALEREEFELHYQPQVDISTGQISGAEALLRWRSPELGLVQPAKFIPLAEETGLIVPIGKWVLRTACAQAIAWMKQGQKPIRFAVNLSARQFREGSLLQTVADALEESGLPPSMLELELTESIIMERMEETITTLNQLHAMGIMISIDDFGTGYSSLSYLKRLPIQVLKIDQSFVRDLDTDADDKAIVSAVVALAHSLQLKVVAEGVETAEQLAYLQQIGCDVMQGYFYSMPLPADDFHARLAESLRTENKVLS